jgi:hypothetical protein
LTKLVPLAALGQAAVAAQDEAKFGEKPASPACPEEIQSAAENRPESG